MIFLFLIASSWLFSLSSSAFEEVPTSQIQTECSHQNNSLSSDSTDLEQQSIVHFHLFGTLPVRLFDFEIPQQKNETSFRFSLFKLIDRLLFSGLSPPQKNFSL